MSLAKFRKVNGGKCTERFHIGPSNGGLCQCKEDKERVDVTVTPPTIETSIQVEDN